MKKISIIAFTTLMFGLSACDMDMMPYDSVPTDEALNSINAFEEARTGIYAAYIGLAGGSYVLAPELQADGFNATADFSNTYGDFYRWNFQSSNSYVEAIWSNSYSAIGRANFFIDSAKKMDEGEENDLTDVQKQQLAVYVGEAYFTRAYCYYYLSTLFCADYNPVTAASTLGLPLQLEYKPKISASEYPERSSLEATYKQITEDLAEADTRIQTARSGIVDYDRYINGAYVNINTAPKQRGNYITVDVVKALRARVALQMDDYKNAAAYAESLIDSDFYPLLNNESGLKDMWQEDGGTETIWQIAMQSADDAGSPLGTLFIGYPTTKKDYIPTKTLIDLYDADDLRLAVYYGDYKLSVSTGTAAQIKFFNKYPGNKNFNTLGGTTRYLNQPKPFRIAEMYLIAAEANTRIGTASSLEKARGYLKTLKTARIPGFSGGNYNNQEVLMNEIMDERERELVCEGYRMMDLKRWGKGVKRGLPQNSGLVLFPGQATTDGLNKPADDYRMVWPIPKSEMDANTSLAGQQNPGY